MRGGGYVLCDLQGEGDRCPARLRVRGKVCIVETASVSEPVPGPVKYGSRQDDQRIPAGQGFRPRCSGRLRDPPVSWGKFIHAADIVKFHPALTGHFRNRCPLSETEGFRDDPGGIRLLRETRALLPAAEALNTQLGIWGADVDEIASEVATAYEKMLLYDEHTWGGSGSVKEYGEAFKQQPADAYKNLEASWEDKTDYIRDASQITRKLLADDMTYLANHVKSKEASVLVYNPLAWERSGWVETDKGRLYVKDVPAGGYRVVSADKVERTQAKSVQGNSIENKYYKLVFDAERGAVVSLIDKQTGREWIDESMGVGFGQYLNERFTFEQTLDYTMTYQQGRAKDWPHPGMHKPGMISEKVMPYRAASPRSARPLPFFLI